MATEWSQNIKDVWSCIPRIEQTACWLMQTENYTIPQFVPKAGIDAVFLTSVTIDAQIRQETWQEMYLLEVAEVDFGPVTVEGYFSNRKWCQDLREASAAGEVSLTDPRCIEMAYLNSP